MARNSEQTPAPATDTAGSTETTGRKRKAPTGPRKQRPFHAAVRVLDSEGNPVQGFQIEVAKISKDLVDVVDFTDANAEYKRIRLDLPTVGGEAA